MTVIRRHDTPEGWREAVYSDCGLYRYLLSISWDEAARHLACVMLNPSQATELANDPTIERCERWARALGFGRLSVVNLFAFRETSPSNLKTAAHPEGADNKRFLEDVARNADTILAAWGVHGAYRDQGVRVEALLRAKGKPVVTLGLTKSGHPRHPLYVAYATEPQAW